MMVLSRRTHPIPTLRIALAIAAVGLFAAGLTIFSAAPAEASSANAFTINGRGWGHGVGMSQWGAYGLAKDGSTHRSIIQHYYTGIGFGTIGDPTMRVRLRSGLSSASLTCSYPYTVNDGVYVRRIAAGVVATTSYTNGKYRVVAGSWARSFSSPVAFRPTQGFLSLRTKTDAGYTGRYRGAIRMVAASGKLMMVNHLAMDQYLRGVLPFEMPTTWPTEALKAQALAARSFAERARRAAGSRAWHVYCDTRSQMYGGASRESSRSNTAVSATTGVVPTYGGTPIEAFYFSSSGGRTESSQYVWSSAVAYLKSVADPSDSSSPSSSWGPSRRTPASLRSALGTSVNGSTLRAVYPVKRGASPRWVKVALLGSGGTTYISGTSLRTKLGLRSTWLRFVRMSISPAAGDAVTVAKGTRVTLSGRMYPALANGASVRMYFTAGNGSWNSVAVTTTRHAQSLPGGSTAYYSTYTRAVWPNSTKSYYFASGSARTPLTRILVK